MGSDSLFSGDSTTRSLYQNIDTSPAISGDMLKSIYDPNTVSSDAFDMDNMVEGAVAKVLTTTLKDKLTGIEPASTADQTDAEIKTAYENNANTNEFSDSEQTKLGNLTEGYLGYFADEAAIIAAHATASAGQYVTNGSSDTVWLWDINTSAWVNTGSNSVGDMLKATYDPTSKNTNAFSMDNMDETATKKVFSDTERTNLSNQSNINTGDMSDSDIKTAYENNADTNAFTNAEKTNLGNQSGTNTGDQKAGWHGSQTRIKIAPSQMFPLDDKDWKHEINDNGAYVVDDEGKISELACTIYIPTGFKATAYMIYSESNVTLEIYENDITDGTTATSRGSGNANTEVNMTDVNSTTINYLTIRIVESNDQVYGGYVVIEAI